MSPSPAGVSPLAEGTLGLQGPPAGPSTPGPGCPQDQIWSLAAWCTQSSRPAVSWGLGLGGHGMVTRRPARGLTSGALQTLLLTTGQTLETVRPQCNNQIVQKLSCLSLLYIVALVYIFLAVRPSHQPRTFYHLSFCSAPILSYLVPAY